jgi:hypothetical protein
MRTLLTCKCPTCSGTGKQTIAVCTDTAAGRVNTSFDMECPICKGGRVITMVQMREIVKSKIAAAKFWCRCGNPSGNVDFHDDAPGSKRHWTCADCGKVTQVG